jgi:hypothetical protein
MAKIPICKKLCCEISKLKKPGNNNLYFPFCTDHQIEAVLIKILSEQTKDKAGLDNMRKTKAKTPHERFYTSAAWRNCSHYVLLVYSDDSLMVRCATSPHLEYHITDKAIHCGHYHKSDQHKATALEFKNLAPQSYSDNVKFSGKPEIMKVWIEETHGKGTIEWLNRKKNETYKLDKYELNKWSKYYLKLFKAELERRNISDPWKS